MVTPCPNVYTKQDPTFRQNPGVTCDAKEAAIGLLCNGHRHIRAHHHKAIRLQEEAEKAKRVGSSAYKPPAGTQRVQKPVGGSGETGAVAKKGAAPKRRLTKKTKPEKTRAANEVAQESEAEEEE